MSDSKSIIASVLRHAADGIEAGCFFVEDFKSNVKLGPDSDGMLRRSLTLQVSEAWLYVDNGKREVIE